MSKSSVAKKISIIRDYEASIQTVWTAALASVLSSDKNWCQE